MGKKIVEGLWDCPYCGAKQIGGLTKHCPACGHPQDDDTKFYLGEEINYLEDDLAVQYGQGADWVCPYCDALNRVHYKYCVNCAAPKESSTADYFTPDPAETPEPQDTPPEQPQSKPPRKKRWWILGVLAACFALLLIAFWPKSYDATVSDASWTREIDIEAYITVQESDWSVPDGGRTYDSKTEFSHNEQVLDHYETRTREVSESVYDGEDEHTTYVDNGDGTFTEETYTTPRYRTEWHTETYEEPVYRDEPVYATKYYYEIDKWVTDRTETSTGTDFEPTWPSYVLAENERTGRTNETYTLTVTVKDKTYEATLPLALWEQLHIGDSVEITVVGNSISEINGQSVE